MTTIITILKVLPLASLVIGVVFIGHYFIFHSLVVFFGFSDPGLQGSLLIILILLSISFILASILAHYREDFIARAFYLLSAGWLALSWNLTVGFGFVWLIIGLSLIFKFKLALNWVAGTVMGLATLFSIYSFWTTFHPRVRKVIVKINNLPEAWKNKIVVQLSDIHLGLVHRDNFLKYVVNKANTLKPELVFITGDLFDGMEGRLEEFVKPLNYLRSKQGIFFITGNHEVYLGTGRALSAVKETSMKVLDNEAVNLNGLQIAGVSYPEMAGSDAHFGKDIKHKPLVEVLNNFIPSLPTILLRHVPTAIKEAKDAHIALQLSGHTHVGQLWPFSLITRLAFGRYHRGLTVEGDFTQYTSTGVGTWGPPMRTGNYPEIVAITLT